MDVVNETRRLVVNGHEFMRYREDVVLVLGCRGSGKSAFVQYIAGDNSKLGFKEVDRELVIVSLDDEYVEADPNYPSLFSYETLNLYDCPGFDDTRDLAHDIASLYFIKNVIRRAKRVKIVLAADYYSFMKSDIFKSDTADFFKLLKYTSLLIKDCGNLSGSIFLVATKEMEFDLFPAQISPTIRPTDKVIDDMCRRLMDIKRELDENNVDVLSGQVLSNAKNLLDCLTLTTNDKPSQLLVFKQSNIEGPLNQNKFMLEEKSRIIEQLLGSPGVSSCYDYFGTYLSEVQLVKINNIIDKIVGDMVDKVNDINEDLMKQPDLHSVHSLRKIKELRFILEGKMKGTGKCDETSINTHIVDQFINMIKSLLESFGKSPEAISCIFEQRDELKFLVDFIGKSVHDIESRWIKKVAAILDKYRRTDTWDGFLINLYTDLSTYEIQQNRHKYNVKDFEHWSVGGSEGIFITADNVSHFIEKLKGTIFPTGQQLPDPATIRGSKLDELNDLLSLTVKQKVEFEPIKDEITIKQNIICLNEIKEAISEPKYDSMSLKLFATDTIYVDCSIRRPSCDVTLIAPYIEVMGEHQVTLKGLNWEAPPKAELSVDGSPGEEGRRGGNFLAVTTSPLDGLTVDVRGSNGRDGQQGGDGADGEDGADPPFYMHGGFPSGTEGKEWDFISNTMSKGVFKVYALKSGEKGSRGARGGNGGKGGDSGIVLATSNLSKRVTDQSSGGNPGIGGKGGLGGKNGRYRVQCRVWSWSWGAWRNVESYIDCGLVDADPERADSGSDGPSGELTGSCGSVRSDGFKMAMDISNYKLYSLEMERSIFFLASMTTFREQVLQTDKLDPLYDSKALIREMIAFEDAYHNLKGMPSLLSIYQDLLARIARYSLKLDQGYIVETNLDTRLLQVLYTAVLGKVCCLRRGFQRTLIIDIRQHMKTTKDELEIFKTEFFISTILHERRKFGEKIKSRIDEAKFLIESQLSKNIDDLMSKTKIETKNLLKEVASLRDDLKKQEHQLKELEKKLEMLAIMGVMKNLMNVLDLMGPYAAVGNAVIQQTITMGESFNKINKTPLNIVDLPKGLDSLNKVTEVAKKAANNRVDNLEKLILDLQARIDKHLCSNPRAYLVLLSDKNKDRFNELKLKLSETLRKVRFGKAKLNQEAAPDTQRNQLSDVESIMDEAETEVKQAVETESLAVENKHSSSDSDEKKKGGEKEKEKDKEKEREEEVEKELKKMTQAFTIFKDMYKDYTTTAEDLKSVSEVSKKLKDQLVKLDQYERQVKEVMIPMLDGMKEDLKQVGKELSNKSQVVLDIAKWEVQKKMRQMKRILEKSTTGFKAQEEFSSLVIEISEGMTTMIGVYDRIETYKQQAELADHIANMNQRGFGIEKVGGDLGEFYQDMRVITQANIVLDRFEDCVEAVKQWVFPFASEFLEDFQLLDHRKKNQNTQTLINDAISKINRLNTKIGDYYSTMKPQHTFVMQGPFDTEIPPTSPFFTWNNNNHSKSISKLLSGDEVMLFANVGLTSTSKAAVKFNKIRLNFKVSGELEHSKLYSELKFFKLNLTHMGNSYYRFKNKIYVIESNEIPIIYFISESDKPLVRNDVLSMLIKGDLLLSPYAMWKIQLTKIPDTQADFEKIKPFVGKIDLELAGEGSYVDESIKGVPDLNLDRFYTLHHTIQDSESQ